MSASLKNATIFGNDININNLLGVTEDTDGHILVTCKNVLKRYEVPSLKQVESWTTKSWHPFSCPALRNPCTGKVICAINKKSLTEWENDEEIDKTHRYNFRDEIHTLLLLNGTIYVVYCCGVVEPLGQAIESRKMPKLGMLNEDQEILEVTIVAPDTVFMAVQSFERVMILKYCIDDIELSFTKVLHYNNASLTGISIFSTGYAVVTWSNAESFLLDLRNNLNHEFNSKDSFSISALQADKNIRILELSSTHAAFIGMQTAGEGAAIVLWDYKFSVPVSTRRLKLYQNPPRGWATSAGIIFPESYFLSFIPYTLQKSELATLVASRVHGNSHVQDTCRNWQVTTTLENGNDDSVIIPDEALDPVFPHASSRVLTVIKSLEMGALSETYLAEEVFRHIKERKDFVLLIESLVAFHDAAEKTIVDALNCIMRASDAHLQRAVDCISVEARERIPLLTLVVPDSRDTDAVNPFSCARETVISIILKMPFTDHIMCNELKRLSFSHSLKLIQYFHYLLNSAKLKYQDDKSDLNSITFGTVSRWMSLLLDSHCNQFVMSSELNVHKQLLNISSDVSFLKKFVEAVSDLEPLVSRILGSKEIPAIYATSCYNIERFIIM